MAYDMTVLMADDRSLLTAPFSNLNQLKIDQDLIQAFEHLRRFCLTINTASDTKRQLPKEILLNSMASVMYRLLHMKSFDPTSMNEIIRLGILVFSSHIFLSWQDVKVPYTHLPDTYRECLLKLKLSADFPPQILLWLLISICGGR